MTVSIGVATAIPGDPADGLDGVERLLSAADTAMYQAKDDGRNRVAVAFPGALTSNWVLSGREK